MIHAASREALATLREQAQGVLAGIPSVDVLATVAGELYAVADLLQGQPRLRRTLGDPATSPQARGQLTGRLFNGRISAEALQLVQAAVRLRWSTPWDLLDGLESLGDDLVFEAAERQGVLDDLEDELFRFERILDRESDLAGLLDDASVPAGRRQELLDRVLSGRVNPLTVTLLHHGVSSQRKRSLRLAIDDLLERAAARRERSVARVLSAVTLTSDQEQHLVAALTTMYGRPISLRVALDPAVRGGLVIRVADEVIDGSIAARLSQARGAFAG